VLSHLADNAMRHRARHVRLEADEKRSTVRPTVSNDGKPISAPNRDWIFDAFFFTARRESGRRYRNGACAAHAVMARQSGSLELKPTEEGAALRAAVRAD
jgi:two-component system, OmpR family, sensor histidine kinase CreC